MLSAPKEMQNSCFPKFYIYELDSPYGGGVKKTGDFLCEFYSMGSLPWLSKKQRNNAICDFCIPLPGTEVRGCVKDLVCI